MQALWRLQGAKKQNKSLLYHFGFCTGFNLD